VSPSDVEAVLGRPAECSIAENINVAMSMNLGEPIVLTEPKSAAARSVCSLAGMVSGRNAGNGRSMGDTP
jgi:MinD-like ATPase involved in chromosome partitioning or flagellar assembly